MDEISKQKLLKWLNSEIGNCNASKHEDDKVIIWECNRIIERINNGLFDIEPSKNREVTPTTE